MTIHVFDLCAQVVNPSTNPDKCKPEDIIQAFERRLSYLREHPEIVHEACGHVDSYEE